MITNKKKKPFIFKHKITFTKSNIKNNKQQKIITYVFLHLQKCGGTYISSLMNKKNEDKQSKTLYINKGHSSVPNKLDCNIYVGNIRHPYEIYRSLWTYGCLKKGDIYKIITQNFPQYAHLYNSHTDIQNFKLWLTLLLNYKIILPKKLYYFDIDIMKKHNIGLATYRFFSIYNHSNFKLLNNFNYNPIIDIFIRNESMASDLQKIGLEYIDIKINDSQKLDIDYYDDEMKELVFKKDKYLFEKFNYPK